MSEKTVITCINCGGQREIDKSQIKKVSLCIFCQHRKSNKLNPEHLTEEITCKICGKKRLTSKRSKNRTKYCVKCAYEKKLNYIINSKQSIIG